MIGLHSIRQALGALWQARALLRLMVRRELLARFTGSVFGLGWLYAQPLLTMAVYYVVFDLVFKARLGEDAPTRAVGLFLIVGMVPWMAFADAVARGMHSLVEAGGVLQKNPLPLVLFPARAIAASAVTYLPLYVVAALFIAFKQDSGHALVWLPPLIIAQFLLAFALAYALAILAAALRDVLQVVGFCLSLGVFISPVLFPATMFPEAWRWLLWVNPMTPVVLGFQDILLAGHAPSPGVWLGVAAWLLAVVPLLDRLIARSRDHLVDWL